MSDFFKNRDIVVGRIYAFRKRDQRDAAADEVIHQGYSVVKGVSDDGQFWFKCTKAENTN